MAPRRRNHFAWIGPLVAVVGLVSYFTLAVWVPVLRDLALLNLVLVTAGVALSAWAVVRRRTWWSLAGLVSSVACAALLFGYVFVLSDQLPASGDAVAVGDPAPALTLPAASGGTVSLADHAGRSVVLVFYRGFW